MSPQFGISSPACVLLSRLSFRAQDLPPGAGADPWLAEKTVPQSHSCRMSALDGLDAPLQSALRSAARATDAYIRTLVDSAWRDLTPHFRESRIYLKFLPRTHPQ